MQAVGDQLTFQTEKVQLLDEMQRRQESYMRREDRLMAKVKELEEEIHQLKTAQGLLCHDAKKEYVTSSPYPHSAEPILQSSHH